MKIRFSKDELDTLTKKARRTNLSREGYCRAILNDSVVHEAPPAEFYELIRELRKTGSGINQLLKLANMRNLPEASRLKKALEDNHAVELMLWRTFEPKSKP